MDRRCWLPLCMVLILVASGCDSKPESDSDMRQGAITPVESPVRIPIPPDNSSTTEELLLAGVPAHDRPWIGADMTRAAEALEKIARSDASKLPRCESTRSGLVFSRMVSEVNLSAIQQSSLTPQLKLPMMLDYFSGSNRIIKLYLSAFLNQKVSDREMIELMGNMLRTSRDMNEIMGEFVKTLDPNDPTYPVRMRGLDQMKTGLAGVVSGSIETLTETNAYRESELNRLAQMMVSTVPQLLPALQEGSRREMMIRLRSLAKDPGRQYLNPPLQELVGKLEFLPQ